MVKCGAKRRIIFLDKMEEVNKVYVGILMIIVGGFYVYYILNREDHNDSNSENWSKKVILVDDWSIAIFLILGGLILLFS